MQMTFFNVAFVAVIAAAIVGALVGLVGMAREISEALSVEDDSQPASAPMGAVITFCLSLASAIAALAISYLLLKGWL